MKAKLSISRMESIWYARIGKSEKKKHTNKIMEILAIGDISTKLDGLQIKEDLFME